MKFDVKNEIINIILNNKYLSSSFTSSHPNSKYSLSLIIDEILYILKSGVSWRNSRSTINYKTLFFYFNKFSKFKIFHSLFAKLKRLYLRTFFPDTFIIDSTSITNKFGVNKIGRNKFYKNKFITKISLLTDINGFPISSFFLKGNKHDNSSFIKHIDELLIIIPKNKKHILADKGYSSKSNYNYLDSNNITHIIPPRKNMKIYNSYHYDKNEYIKRIKTEHIFGRLKLFRRIDKRYEKTLKNFSSFVFLGFVIIGTNIFNKNL